MKRPFRGLRSAPDPRYDVVVIGAGVGGLVAANLLVRAGLKVLVVEQHYMAGGYCSTFRRGGFTFDATTHFYPLLGNPGTLTGRLMAELGVATRWVRMDPVDVFHFPDGSRFAVPADLDAYLAALVREFPHQTAALEAFFAAVREAYFAGLLHYFRGVPAERAGRFGELSGWTVSDALERFIADPKLKLLLTADAPHWGSPPDRTSFVFDSMLRLSYFLGNYYPAGGSQAFVDELARCFEERGGHLLMSTVARRIEIERGRAAGVALETLRGPRPGISQVRCRAVLSNADLLLTLERLVGERHLPPDYLAAVRRLRPTWPCWLTHLGLSGVPLADLERVQGYYWDGWDARRYGSDALRFKLFVPTLYEPAMAPAGGQVLIVQKVYDPEAHAEVAGRADGKRRMEALLLAQLEGVLPGIGERIVARTSASAHTSWRFTLNHQGAMLGWEMSPEQLGDARPGVVGPLPGLFLTGHWVQPGGGVTPVIVSAQQAAQAVIAAVAAVTGPPGGKRDGEPLADATPRPPRAPESREPDTTSRPRGHTEEAMHEMPRRREDFQGSTFTAAAARPAAVPAGKGGAR